MVVSFCSVMFIVCSFVVCYGYSINVNYEFVVFGLVNIGVGVFQGFVISGVDLCIVVNDMVGGKI